MGSEPGEQRKAGAGGKRARLQAELEATRELLRQERERRLGAEERLARLEDDWLRMPAGPGRNGSQELIRSLLTSLGGGLLSAVLVLALLPWQSGRQPGLAPSAQPPVAGVEAGSGASPPGESKAAARQAGETLEFRCDEPCWLDIREAESRRPVFAKLHKGTALFAMGSGLDVFSGRADLVKVRINDGAEQPLLPGAVVGSRVFRPSP